MIRMRIGRWTFRPDRRELRAGEEVRQLTDRESDLLAYLAARPGEVVATEELLTEVWGYAHQVRSRAVTHTAGRLRRKLEPEDGRLTAVYGQGYVLDLPDTRQLVGRGALLKELRRALEVQRRITLYGVGGVGKSVLARALAKDIPHLWLDASSLHSPEDFTEALSTALKLPPDAYRPETLGQLVRARTDLLVVDAAEGLDAWLWEWAQAWCDAKKGWRMVITSRVHRGSDHGTLVTPLDEADAVELLRRRARQVQPEEEFSPSELSEVVRMVSGVPLAVELAAARLRILTLPQLRTRLDSNLGVLGGGQSGLDAMLRSAWEGLTAQEQALLGTLALLSRPTDVDTLEAAASVTQTELLDALDGLVRSALVVEADRRWWLLDLVRAFVRPQALPGVRAAFVHFATARAVEELKRVDDDPVRSLTTLTEAAPDLTVALEVGGPDEAIAAIALALLIHDARFGRAPRARTALERLNLAELPPALAADVLVARASLLNAPQEAAQRAEMAHDGYTLARAHGSPNAVALAWARWLHAALPVQGVVAVEEACDEMLLYLSSQSLAPAVHATALLIAANIRQLASDFVSSMALNQEASSLAPRESTVWRSALFRLANLHRWLGHPERCLAVLRDIEQSVLDSGLARQIHHLGLLQIGAAVEAGEREVAQRWLSIVEPHLDAGPHPARTRLTIAVHRAQLDGSPPAAFESIAEEAQTQGEGHAAGLALFEAAYLYHAAGDLPEARRVYGLAASAMKPEVRHRANAAMASAWRGLLEAQAGDSASAETYLEDAGEPGGLAGNVVGLVRAAVQGWDLPNTDGASLALRRTRGLIEALGLDNLSGALRRR